MTQLVLSLFPGIGMLDTAFEEEGFCVVRGPDVLWGGDIRKFHPPAGKFDGVIGGPPCQAFSRLKHFADYWGYSMSFGDLIPEFVRCITESVPDWFVMENVPQAPKPQVEGYEVWNTCLNNRQLGEEQERTRRWSFGVRGRRQPLMIETAVFENPLHSPAAIGGTHGPPGCQKNNAGTVTMNCKTKKWFDECKRRQGLPDDFDLPPFTVAAKCKAVGNGVPMAMGRAIAKAVRKATT